MDFELFQMDADSFEIRLSDEIDNVIRSDVKDYYLKEKLLVVKELLSFQVNVITQIKEKKISAKYDTKCSDKWIQKLKIN